MFSASLKQASSFKEIVDAICPMVADAHWKANATGLHLQGIDAAHVLLTELHLPPEWFETFEINSGKGSGELHFCLPTGSMRKIFANTGSDRLHIETGGALHDTVLFRFEKGDSVTEMELHVINSEYDERTLFNDLEPICKLTLPSTDFAGFCKKLEFLEDSVRFVADKVENEVTMSATGDLGKGNIRLTNSNRQTVSILENVDAEYSMRYLLLISKAAAVSSTVVLEFYNGLIHINYGPLSFFFGPKEDLNK